MDNVLADDEEVRERGISSTTKRSQSPPHALERSFSECTRSEQRRNRQILFACNVLTSFLYVGATLGWGPMQLMVSRDYPTNKVVDIIHKQHPQLIMVFDYQ